MHPWLSTGETTVAALWPKEEESRLVTSSLMPYANAEGRQTGDTGRHRARCKLQIGSNVRPKQICEGMFGLERDSQMEMPTALRAIQCC